MKKNINEFSAENARLDAMKSAAKKQYNKKLKKVVKSKKLQKDKNAKLELNKLEKLAYEHVVNRLINKYTGMISVNEYMNAPGITNPDMFAYQPGNFGSVENAFDQLLHNNKEVSKLHKISSFTLKQFLKDIYQGGNHEVSFRKLSDYLSKKGIKVYNRRGGNIAGLQTVN